MRPKSTVEQFWARSELHSSGCRLWRGPINAQTGYGNYVAFGGKGAHRIAWILTYGEVPEGLCVLHRCDVRLCVNPAHLFLGTKRDNFRDMVSKGRAPLQQSPERGEQHRRAKFSEGQVRRVFKLRAAGRLQREIAAELGMSRPTVNAILNGYNWAHLQAGALS